LISSLISPAQARSPASRRGAQCAPRANRPRRRRAARAGAPPHAPRTSSAL